jgi:predicted exporter
VIRFTVLTYRFFKARRPLFYAVMLSTAFLFGWLSLKIEFEEDITKLLPPVKNEKGTETLVFSNLKVKDMVFVLFHSRDKAVEPDTLTALCDEFMQALLEKDSVYHTINSILYRIDEDFFQDGVNFLYEHVATFLDISQYSRLDSLLTVEAVEQQMDENYSVLISPAGSEFQDIIVRDPVALRNIFLSELNVGGGLGGNYTFVNQHIASADSSVVIAFLAPNFQSFNSKQNLRLAALIEDEIARAGQRYPEVEVLYHGSPIRGVYNSKRIKMDLVNTVSFSLVLICILLLLCFKNKSTLFYLITPVIYGTLFSMAVIYLIKGTMSLMAVGIGALIMGVAFSYVLHVITHHKYVNDPEQLLKEQTLPVMLGTLTTIGAFMSLLLTESELLKDFGLFASLGLAGTTLFSLLFLPQLFNLKRNRKSKTAFNLLEKINSFPFEKQKWLTAGLVCVSVICFFRSDLNNSFDSNLQNIGYHDAVVVRSEQLLSLKTTGTDTLSTIYFAAVSEDLDSALIAARKLCRRLDEAVENNYIAGYTPAFSLFVPTEEQRQRIEHWHAYWTDEKKADIRKKVTEAAAQHKFAANTFAPFFEMIDAEYEPVSLHDAGIIPKDMLSSIIEFTDGRYMVFIPVRMSGERLLEAGRFITEGRDDILVLDPMFYTDDMVKMIRDDFNIILGISSLFVLLVLLVSFRNTVLSALAFLPMCLSWYVVLGMMAIFHIKFNLINIIISSFIFGIGVDYSIFIMDGLLVAFRTRKPLLIFHKTAIFFSAVILIITVSSLLFAVHPAISSIGIATLIGMGATILIAYSLQPFLFKLLISDRVEKGKAPYAFANLLLKNKPASVKAIHQNYFYKGVEVEGLLHNELRQTNRYALLSATIADNSLKTDNWLDYGCGYGFCSYWISFADASAQVTGFDTREEMIALAENCYRKTDHIRFTSDASVLNAAYDAALLRLMPDEAVLTALLNKAKVVAVRNNLLDQCLSCLQKAGFGEYSKDAAFTVFKAG